MQPGEQIGAYVISHKIGEGGMSIVYLAEHAQDGTRVVVKELRKHLALDEELVKRFVLSYQIMHRLRHPHLARVLDYIERDGNYFVVEEYLSGGSLADLIDKGEQVSEAEAFRWCRDALRAVDYAHQWGIVHRDLKPGNLMLNDAREIKVTDFGIARVFGGPRLTQAGEEMGTPEYMSPEQIRAPHQVYHLTDVYSMGVVLYELLTGRVPFEGQGKFDIQQAVVQKPVPSPRQFNPGISRDAERIVLRAMQKNPEDRFGGCTEFALHLDQRLSGGPPPRPVSWVRKHPRVAATLVLLLVLVLALWINARDQSAPKTAEAPPAYPQAQVRPDPTVRRPREAKSTPERRSNEAVYPSSALPPKVETKPPLENPSARTVEEIKPPKKNPEPANPPVETPVASNTPVASATPLASNAPAAPAPVVSDRRPVTIGDAGEIPHRPPQPQIVAKVEPLPRPAPPVVEMPAQIVIVRRNNRDLVDAEEVKRVIARNLAHSTTLEREASVVEANFLGAQKKLKLSDALSIYYPDSVADRHSARMQREAENVRAALVSRPSLQRPTCGSYTEMNKADLRDAVIKQYKEHYKGIILVILPK